jgi:hypothetical protein
VGGENVEKVMPEREIRIITENRVGMLAEVTSVIAKAGVNIENICAYATGATAMFCLLTNDNERARKALTEKGYQVQEMAVIVLRLWNRPGTLSEVAAKFREHGVNLQYVYGTSSREGERTTLVFAAEDNDKALEIFDRMVLEEAEKTL